MHGESQLKRQLKILFVFTSIFIYAFFLITENPHAQSEEEDFINLSHVSSSKEFYEKLDGEWLFFEQQLLNPEDINFRLLEGKKVTIPDSFEVHTGDVNTYGTYQAKVKIPSSYVGETLAIHVPFQYSAYTLFVDDHVITKNGEVGKDSSTHQAEMAPSVGYFIAQSDEITLTMQVSSFDHIRGGFENPIFIGSSSVVSQKNYTNIILNLFLNVSIFLMICFKCLIFIIGLFIFLFSLNRRQEQLFFIFGMFAMLISARALFTVPFYYTIIFTEMSWLWGTRLEYILSEACSLFYLILLWKWHEKEFSKKVLYGLIILLSTMIVITLFTQPVFFQEMFFKVFTITIPLFIYMIYVVTKSIKNNNKIAKVNVFGMLLIFLAFFNDFAIGNNWYNSVNLMLPAVGIYVLIHVIFMSRDFAQRSKKTEEQYRQLLILNEHNEQLTKQLQKEVKFKDEFLANTSHELRNPLHGIINITQTLLTQQSGQLNEDINKKLQLQLSIARVMSQTIEDLLDLSRLKEFKIKLHLEPIQIRSLAIGVVDILKVYSDSKNLTIHNEIPEDFPHVIGDRNRLIQILFNLIHNAIKYTNEGTITISADIDNNRAYRSEE